MNSEIATSNQNAPAVNAGFFNLDSFELMQRVSKAFASSDLVPKQYQGNLANCMIAMDMAQRIGANPLMVMQNLYIVHGTPGWSSKFLIATINASGRYSSLRYEWAGKPGEDNYGCRAWAIEKATGERLDGVWVTWKMVNAEGWSKKAGSKWLTMPDQMFIYRAAAFWQRAYAPELGMGLTTAEELGDVIDVEQQKDGTYSMPSSSMPEPPPAPVSKSAKKAAAGAEEPGNGNQTGNPAPAAPDAAGKTEQPKATAASNADPDTGEIQGDQSPKIDAGKVKYLQTKIGALELPEPAVTAMLARIGADSLDQLNELQFDTIKAELLSMGA